MLSTRVHLFRALGYTVVVNILIDEPSKQKQLAVSTSTYADMMTDKIKNPQIESQAFDTVTDSANVLRICVTVEITNEIDDMFDKKYKVIVTFVSKFFE